MNLVTAFYCGVVFVICFLAEKAVSSSDEEILEALPHPVCRTPDSPVFMRVTKLGGKCYELAISKPTEKAQRNPTIENFRNLTSELCQKQSLIQNCLEETTTNITICRDEFFLKTFKIYREVIEKLSDIGCSDNGERLSTMLNDILYFIRSKVADKKCTDRFDRMFRDLVNSEVDIYSKLFHLFKETKTFAECFNKEESTTDSFKDNVKIFMEAIINTMKCVNPQDGELVPCSSIDPSSIAPPNICDVRTFGSNMSLYDNLEEDSASCDFDFLRYADSVWEEDAIQERLNRVCLSYNEGLPYCYKQAKIVSEVCLNDTEKNQFNLLGDFMKSAAHIACSEGDKRLTDILTEVFRRKNPGQNLMIWDCVETAQAPSSDHRSSSKNMRLYHEMEYFKECLVGKLQGHQTTIDAATSLINELLKKVKCVHPEDGTTVLCEALHHAVH